MYELLDDFDEAAKILPVLKEEKLDVELDLELARAGN